MHTKKNMNATIPHIGYVYSVETVRLLRALLYEVVFIIKFFFNCLENISTYSTSGKVQSVLTYVKYPVRFTECVMSRVEALLVDTVYVIPKYVHNIQST
jgi:hypothetical protein